MTAVIQNIPIRPIKWSRVGNTHMKLKLFSSTIKSSTSRQPQLYVKVEESSKSKNSTGNYNYNIMLLPK